MQTIGTANLDRCDVAYSGASCGTSVVRLFVNGAKLLHMRDNARVRDCTPRRPDWPSPIVAGSWLAFLLTAGVVPKAYHPAPEEGLASSSTSHDLRRTPSHTVRLGSPGVVLVAVPPAAPSGSKSGLLELLRMQQCYAPPRTERSVV